MTDRVYWSQRNDIRDFCPSSDVKSLRVLGVDRGGPDQSAVVVSRFENGRYEIEQVVTGEVADALIAAMDAYPVGVRHD